MKMLEEITNKKNISQNNRRELKKILTSFIESAVLDKELSDNIMLGDINQNYINYIQLLLIKLSTINIIQSI